MWDAFIDMYGGGPTIRRASINIYEQPGDGSATAHADADADADADGDATMDAVTDDGNTPVSHPHSPTLDESGEPGSR